MNLTDFDLIIFDKDGTLIDFHLMWSGLIEGVAARLEAGTGQALTGDLYELMGYDAAARRTLPGGPLAATPMAELWTATTGFLRGRGLSAEEAEAAVAAAWFAPDPIAMARPLADLPAMFARLRVRGIRLAVATTDDRLPTVATLAALGVLDSLATVVCGDDGVPVKPAPDMVLSICQELGVAPARVMVVGDSLYDMRMARAAGAVAVGVLTGVTPREVLEPAADWVVETVEELV